VRRGVRSEEEERGMRRRRRRRRRREKGERRKEKGRLQGHVHTGMAHGTHTRRQ